MPNIKIVIKDSKYSYNFDAINKTVIDTLNEIIKFCNQKTLKDSMALPLLDDSYSLWDDESFKKYLEPHNYFSTGVVVDNQKITNEKPRIKKAVKKLSETVHKKKGDWAKVEFKINNVQDKLLEIKEVYYTKKDKLKNKIKKNKADNKAVASYCQIWCMALGGNPV